MSEARRRAFAVLAGLAVGAGQVPFSLTPVALAGLAAIVLLAAGAGSAWRAALVGWWGGAAYFALALHWIVEPFMVDAARDGWMAPFALVFLSGGLALFWAAALWLAHRLAGGRRGFWLAAAAALAGAEAARALVLTGFPWALLGHVWSGGAGLQLSAWIGPLGLTALTCLLAAGVAATGPRARAVPALLAAWLLPLGAGALRPSAPVAGADAPLVRVVQPNAPQDEKWDPARSAAFFERALELTAQAGAPDLVVWPETSVPYAVEAGAPAVARIAEAAAGARVAVGAQRPEGARFYNTLFVLGPGGDIAQTYDKHHLVPFGEYMPLGDLAGRLGIYGLAARDGFGYSAGPGPRPIDLGPLGTALPLICYEAIFAEEVGAAPRPNWLLHVTNDAWFGTFAGPQQHLAQARMRAVEQGVPLVRAANTGISAVIDARGAVVEALPLGVSGRIDAALPSVAAPTPYSRTGDWPAGAAILAGLAAAWAWGRRDRA